MTGQHGADLILEEWTFGPYYREISLTQTVMGPLANATYGNGVLVLSIPKGGDADADSKVNVTLHPIAAIRGE